MEKEIENIKSLIASGDATNMHLAIELANALALNIDEILSGYKILLNIKPEAALTIDFLLGAKYTLILNLSKSGLDYLPEEIAYFSHLNALDVSDNNLSSLPDELASLAQLQALNLNHNKFVQIPEVIYKIQPLYQLYISYNSITWLSPKLGDLKELSHLGLRNCRLSILPDSLFHEQSKLFRLDLGENKLQTLPTSIGHLPKLNQLHLDRNLLKSLPIELADLRYLQELDISYNPFLKTLPIEWSSMRSLANIYMQQTPIENRLAMQHALPWTEFWV